MVYLTHHVGLGTFRPVSVDDLDQHEMHYNFINSLKKLPNPSISQSEWTPSLPLGTTSIRTLETIGNKFNGEAKPTLVGPISLSNQAISGRLSTFSTFPYQKSTLSHARFCLRRSGAHSGCLSARPPFLLALEVLCLSNKESTL